MNRVVMNDTRKKNRQYSARPGQAPHRDKLIGIDWDRVQRVAGQRSTRDSLHSFPGTRCTKSLTYLRGASAARWYSTDSIVRIRRAGSIGVCCSDFNCRITADDRFG